MIAGLVTALMVLALSSLSALLGDLSSAHARHMEQRWQKRPESLNLTQWQAADAYLHRALQYSPAHPDYLQALGRMSSWYLLLDGEARQTTGARGLEYFRQALEQRPYWAYGWSELALLKAQLGELDEEFSAAVSRTLQYGPYERQALQNVLNAGLGVWPQLGLMQQMELHGVFRRMLTLPWTAGDALKLVEFYGMKSALCLGVQDDPEVSQSVKRRCARP